MYLGKRQKFDWVFALAVSDILAILISLLVTVPLYQRFFPDVDPDDFGRFAGLGNIIVYLVLVFVVLKKSGLYTWAALNTRLFRPVRLAWNLLLAGLGLLALIALMEVPKTHVWRWVVLQTIVAFALVWGARLFVRFIIMEVLKLIPEERIAFVGWSPRTERVVRSLEKEIGRFQAVLGYFEVAGHPELNPPEDKGFKSLGSLDTLDKVHEQQSISLLIVDEVALPPEKLQEIAAVCSRSVINFRMIPSAFDILSKRLSTRVVAGVPLLGIQGVPLDLFHNRLAKRAVDILGALVGLALSGPVILICMFLIKKESPGPAFYRQVRLGRAGRPFDIIKLRSMKLDAEAVSGAKWAVENDPRRLKIGAFLRKSNLDETPQFWNVLKGEMSLVGPRPERPQFVETFSHNVRHYNLRHNCKPGLTSWAAVHGLRGNTSLTDRLDYDLYYFENWSLWLDFKTMIMTLMPPKNAY